jgi:large subunit ribosomal protein L9
MARNVQLLLLHTVENLGIVGDIVRVKPGYARNYLLPQQLAGYPTPSKIEALKEQRAKAQKELDMLRAAREELLARMQEVTITLVRSCNDKGVLYGSVTQRDLADGLQEAGYDVGVRSIRLQNAIRRIGEYPVPIQFDKDLRAEVMVIIEPDQPLEEREEMEIDDEGNLVDKRRAKKGRPAREAGAASPPAAGPPATSPPATSPPAGGEGAEPAAASA